MTTRQYGNQLSSKPVLIRFIIYLVADNLLAYTNESQLAFVQPGLYTVLLLGLVPFATALFYGDKLKKKLHRPTT